MIVYVRGGLGGAAPETSASTPCGPKASESLFDSPPRRPHGGRSDSQQGRDPASSATAFRVLTGYARVGTSFPAGRPCPGARRGSSSRTWAAAGLGRRTARVPLRSCARPRWRDPPPARSFRPARPLRERPAGSPSFPRAPPRGDAVAFLDHPVFGRRPRAAVVDHRSPWKQEDPVDPCLEPTERPAGDGLVAFRRGRSGSRRASGPEFG